MLWCVCVSSREYSVCVRFIRYIKHFDAFNSYNGYICHEILSFMMSIPASISSIHGPFFSYARLASAES